MPEKCRVVICGFDPMLVRGYVKTGERALWWYLPDELYEDYKVKPGDKIKGKLMAVYNAKGERRVATERPPMISGEEDWSAPDASKGWGPNAVAGDPFTWSTTKETGLAVLLPPEVITRYGLTEFHFLELVIEKIVRASGEEVDVYPGEEKCRKWWPEEKMKLHYYVEYVAP
ncbi:MAG: hypothetical protein H5T97_00105 [Firmicutes bacterium]|nr:hypothetical protein [Bacillota bacterium]